MLYLFNVYSKVIYLYIYRYLGFPDGASSKELACQCKRHETQVWSVGWEDPLEKGMATHSSVLAWRIPWTEEPGGLQSIESQSDMTEAT